MAISKRNVLKLAAGAALAAPVGAAMAASGKLSKMTSGAVPIGVEERRARVEKAQRLMRANDIDALVIEPGSAMVYFAGIRWWRSERFTGVIIPREGEIAVVTPYFEEPSVRESMTFGDDVRTWNEHENPFERVAGILKDRGLSSGRIGVEETVRYFIVDGLKEAAPKFKAVNAAPVTRGCRMVKSPAELALMQLANDVTMAGYASVHARIEQGMTPSDISTMMDEATVALGGAPEFSMALLGEASAYPHGSGKPQEVREGEIILMDCGCAVEDYQSDISRTFVFGEPTARQREVWNTVKRGQEIALETAQVGTPAGAVDDAVRAYYESLGYGPGYKTPGLPHRTGHGIGMDGHEPVNFVHGEETKLAPGMCFSNEPGLYAFGEFGVRLEDCLYITEEGPKLFSGLSPSIDKPFG
ncbi:MAG: Xaa-Pro peptidase family protein [Parvularculaceae bacterium]|nr:aminopeptidase P family protein [Amphiplicatus sp.]MCB9956608.1 aminopeptidase P family protein [Caulobacterales bacterium]HRX38663.1 Xaa-Pro peptidase family protein [Parvularculaceae bacterium]